MQEINRINEEMIAQMISKLKKVNEAWGSVAKHLRCNSEEILRKILKVKGI